MMNLVSRLIGQHKLLLLPFYSFTQRYIRAHQQHVTQVLAYLVQACHDLVPPDEVLPVLRSIASAFINEGCGPELIQVGLNAVREVVTHCPVVLEEAGMHDLVQDLVQYRNYHNRGVVAAARALLNLIREIYPALLRRRDRGRGLAGAEEAAYSRPTAYGQRIVATGCVARASLSSHSVSLSLRLARGSLISRPPSSASRPPPLSCAASRAPTCSR